MAISREDVMNAYRFILGREPESEEVIANHLGHENIADIRHAFMLSAEFTAGLPTPPVGQFVDRREQIVEYECSGEVLAGMLEKTAAEWNKFGDEAPHWSVLTHDRFQTGKIEDHINEFYASGGVAVDVCLNSLRRAGIDASHFGRVLDFGCGVGRLTLALAEIAETAVGVDVSAGHLKLARERSASIGATNAEFCQIKDMRDLDSLSGFDLVLSLMVLQHNPPPIMAYAFRRLLRALNPGGHAIVQIPTFMSAGAFHIDRYLSEERAGMEMHGLPQAAIFKIMDEEGCRTVEIREDAAIGHTIGISQLFTIEKKALPLARAAASLAA